MPEPTLAGFFEGWILFREAVLCAVVAGAVLGWLGVFVLLRRQVFAAAGLTQASALGVDLGFFAGIHLGVEVPPLASAIVAALVAAGLLSLPVDRLRLSRESVLAFVWVGAGAGALLVGEKITQEAHDIASILFGTAVLVDPADFRAVLVVSGVVVVGALGMHRGLAFAGFDPEGARVQGLPVRLIEGLFLAGFTVLVATTTRALGALPVFAFSVLPAAAALLLSPRMTPAFPLAAVIGALSGFGGYVFAYLEGFPVGASQTFVCALFVVPGVVVRGVRGAE